MVQPVPAKVATKSQFLEVVGLVGVCYRKKLRTLARIKILRHRILIDFGRYRRSTSTSTFHSVPLYYNTYSVTIKVEEAKIHAHLLSDEVVESSEGRRCFFAASFFPCTNDIILGKSGLASIVPLTCESFRSRRCSRICSISYNC